jgi:hypothetical protein
MGKGAYARYLALKTERAREHERVPEQFRDACLRNHLIWVLEPVASGEAPGPMRLDDADCCGWWLATAIVRHIEDWPLSILKEFGIPWGDRLAKIDAQVQAEQKVIEDERRRKWIAEAPEREAREREKREELGGRYMASLERSYPEVNGRRTIGGHERKDYREEGYSDAMLDDAIAELHEAPGVFAGPPNREICPWEFQEALRARSSSVSCENSERLSPAIFARFTDRNGA